MADESVYAGAPVEPSGPTDAQVSLSNFWPKVSEEVSSLQINDFKNQDLPLARIKKIMKLDEDVKMISAEAPLLFAKAAEIFISELSLRAWIHTEDNKRRTLQRNDIALAVSKYDQFDFLIDIVPREDAKPMKRETSGVGGSEQVQYYLQFPGQASAGVGQQVQVLANPNRPASPSVQAQMAGQQQPQAVSSSQPTVSSGQQQVPLQQAQVYQQVVTSTGEMQNVPIQLSEAQLQAIRVQMQNKQPGQPIVIQTQAAPEQFATTAQVQQSSTNILQQAGQGYFQPGETQNTS